MTIATRVRRMGAVLAVAGMAACGGDATGTADGGGETPRPEAVVRVDVSPSTQTVALGEAVVLAAVPRGASGTALDRPVAWSSTDTTVARVSAAGRVTAVGVGTAVVRADAEGRRGEATIHVPVPRVDVAGVRLAPDSVRLPAGGAGIAVAASAHAADGTLLDRPIAFSVEDPSVAAVTAEGRVTGLRAGRTLLHATSEGVRASIPVVVVAAPSPATRFAATHVEGESLGQRTYRLDTLTWRDARGVGHPAERVVLGGELTLESRPHGVVYRLRVGTGVYLLDAPGEVRLPVEERWVDDGGMVRYEWTGDATRIVLSSLVAPWMRMTGTLSAASGLALPIPSQGDHLPALDWTFRVA